jgi:hypothetical protein
MMTKGSTTTARAREMRGVLRRWARSGLTQREFGEREGFSASTLAWWGHVFRHAGVKKRRRPPVGRPVKEVPTLVELKVTAEPLPAAPLEVVLRAGQVIRVPSEFSAATLRAIVAALESAC